MRSLTSGVVISCGAAFLSATAADAAPRYRFDLPAAPLATSVARISAQAGVTIIATTPALLAARGPSLHLDASVDEVLTRLFEKTPAQAIRVTPTSWRIVARRAVQTGRRSRPPPSVPIPADIVVTASKHVVLLSAYPASITVIEGPALTRFGGTPDTSAIARLAPGVQSTHLGPGRDKLFLRGIADSSFNGSSAALVGLYVNDVRLTYNAPDPNLRLYDVDRVEILEGPQGTLYGAGSIAGLIRIAPRPPDATTRSGDVWLGGTVIAHGTAGGDAGGVVNLPLFGGAAAMRLVGYVARDGGYIDDAGRGRTDVNRSDTLGGRVALRVPLEADWLIDLGAIVQDIRNRDAQYAERGLPPLTRSSIAAEPSSDFFRTGYLTVSGRIGGVDLTSTTDIVDQNLRQSFLPNDGNAAALYHQSDAIRLVSEEARLSSRKGAVLGWTAGLSVLDSRTEQIRTSLLDGFERSLGRAHNGLTEIALFGELTAHLGSRLSLTAGGRLTSVRLVGLASGAEEKSGDAAKIPGGSEPHFSGVRHEFFAVPSLALGWSPTPAWLAFGRFSEGYRPGGQTASGIIEEYDADRIDSLEVGLRLAAHGRARLSAQFSGAISRWRNIQADILSANGLPETRNIGDGEVRSLSASMRWKPDDAWEVKLAATLAGGTVTGRDATLDQVIRTSLPNVARDTLAASVAYSRAIDDRHRISAGASLNHVGRSVLGSDSITSMLGQGGYWLASGGVDFSVSSSTISIDVDNLFDSAANSFAFGTPTFSYDDHQMTPLRPRSIRLGFRHTF
ncbi:hypothetical protein GCM10009087_00930 [Sphingomonas oligophenolica]|uniref:TonB-dependent receptor n=1 Tax=Sphingomonas oligophenolica TaxID=301154 RepID=A0ABU9Y1B6_9SPHN